MIRHRNRRYLTLNAGQSIIDQTDKEFWFNIFSTSKIMYICMNP